MYRYSLRLKLYLGLEEDSKGNIYFIRLSFVESSTGFWREQVKSKDVIKNYIAGSPDKSGFREISKREFDSFLNENLGLFFRKE